MKKLKIYMENEEFVIEHVNSFGHGIKRSFISENALKESLDSYAAVIDQYELEVSDELWAMVINYVSSEGFQRK
ncbi:MAG TPA: hypothetical protein VNR61_05850 [Niallia sp.]|nr:hypothetical protein [Niallia sp.]